MDPGQDVDHLAIGDILVAGPGQAADESAPVIGQGGIAAEGDAIDDRALHRRAIGIHTAGTDALQLDRRVDDEVFVVGAAPVVAWVGVIDRAGIDHDQGFPSGNIGRSVERILQGMFVTAWCCGWQRWDRRSSLRRLRRRWGCRCHCRHLPETEHMEGQGVDRALAIRGGDLQLVWTGAESSPGRHCKCDLAIAPGD